MHQFDKSIFIAFNPHDSESVAAALLQYQQHLEDGSAFRKQVFNIEFVALENNSQRRLQLSDIRDETLRTYVRDALSLTPDGYSESSHEAIAEDDPVYISEPIFFALALQFPQLQEQVIRCARSIVAYARDNNDTDDMWRDDMDVFGAEALYLLARSDLNNLPLLAQFFIPYWDDEHAGEYHKFLADIVHRYGWCREVISAYIWCDNDQFRYQMFGHEWGSDTHYQPLGEYLRANPQEYLWFKQALQERLLDTPKMMVSIHNNEEAHNPVLDFYLTLLPMDGDRFDDEDCAEFAQQHFIHASLEDEALDLQNRIQAQSSTLLFCYSASDLRSQESMEREESRGDGLRMVKPLILALPQGEALWQYVYDGSQQDALQQLPVTELAPLAKKAAPEFYRDLQDELIFGDSNKDICDDLFSVLYSVRRELQSDDEDAEDFADVLTSDSEEQRARQYLRLLDIFYRVLGQDEFPDSMRELLVDDDELLTTAEYFRRFSHIPAEDQEKALRQKVLHSLLDEFCDMDERLGKALLQRARQLIGSERTLANPASWADDAAQSELEIGHFTLMAFILHNDWQQNFADEQTPVLAEYLQQDSLWLKAANLPLKRFHIEGGHYCPEGRGMSTEQVQLFRDYFCAKQPVLNQQQMIGLINRYAHRDDCTRRSSLSFNQFSELQNGYHFFNDHDDDYQRILLICFWLQHLPLPCSVPAKRIWKLMVALAPIRVTRLVMQAFSDDSYDVEFADVLQEINHYEALEKSGINQGYLMAFQLSQCQPAYHTEKYIHWLDQYAAIDDTDTSMFGSRSRKLAQELQHGLRYINEADKIQFYRLLELRHPRFNYSSNDELQQNFRRTLERNLRLSLKHWHSILASESGSSQLDCDSKVLSKKPLRIAADYHTREDFVPGDMTWLGVWLVEDMDDDYEIFAGPELQNAELKNCRGNVLLFKGGIDRAQISARANELLDSEACLQQLHQQVLNYLDGNAGYEQTATLAEHYLLGEGLELQAPEYTMTGVDSFIWLLDEEQRDRLARLFFNNNYRGFKLVRDTIVQGYLSDQVKQGKMSFSDMLEADEDDNEEQAAAFLLLWLLRLDIRPEHILLYCVKNRQFEACRHYVIALANDGLLKSCAAFLHTENRATLVEMLAEQNNGRSFLSIFAKDKARKIRDIVARFIG